MHDRPTRSAERRTARALLGTLLLVAALAGCGSDRVVVRTVTVERDNQPAPVANVDPDVDGVVETTTTTTGTTTSAAQDAPSAGFTRCDAHISAKNVTTTCGFATNAFYEYFTSGEASRIRVYSPATHRVFSARCSTADGEVECTTSDGGVARFSQAAVDHYSQSQADAYAAGHDIGSTASGGGGTSAQTPPASAPPPPPPASSASDFCDTHDCIPNYDNGNGSTVQCSDGTYSQSGGIRGACSHHGGVG